MPASDANPQASLAAPHPVDAICVAARSDLANVGSTHTVMSKAHNNGNSFDLSPTSNDLLPALVVAAYHKDATINYFWPNLFGNAGIGTVFWGGRFSCGWACSWAGRQNPLVWQLPIVVYPPPRHRSTQQHIGRHFLPVRQSNAAMRRASA